MADTGFKSPSSTAVRVAGVVDPTNAYTSDDAMAIITPPNITPRQDYYVFTGLYSAIPDGATINGIEVNVEANAVVIEPFNGDSAQISIAISKDGGSNFSAEKAATFVSVGGETTKVYGNSTDTWGLSSLTKDSFSDANFRLYVGVTGIQGAIEDVYIDHIPVKVYYTVGSIISSNNPIFFSGD